MTARWTWMVCGAIWVVALVFPARAWWAWSMAWNEHLAETDTESAVVTAREVPPGKRLQREDLKTISLPANYLPSSVHRNQADVLGTVTRSRVLAGEFLRAERLTETEIPGPTAALGPNRRAIQFPKENDMDRWLTTGDRVDVLGRDAWGACVVAEGATVLPHTEESKAKGLWLGVSSWSLGALAMVGESPLTLVARAPTDFGPSGEYCTEKSRRRAPP